jgi:DNA-binding MarR family transcriptional regulator
MPETTTPESKTTQAMELARALGPLRRVLLKATRSEGDLPDIPDAQIEVLRLLVAAGPLSSATIAERLGLARSTVSNVLKTMTGSGLLEREPATEDLRSTLVSASAHAHDLLTRYDRISAVVVAEALGMLSQASQQTLVDAVQPLRELTVALAAAAA